MEVNRKTDENGCDAFFVKERIGSQTFYMEFSICDETADTVYVNVCVALYNKRTQAALNEQNKVLTGKDPIKTVSVGMKAFGMLEKAVLECYIHQKNVCFMVWWTDNRRREAYSKVLSKKGYVIGHMYGGKCLHKMVKKSMQQPVGESETNGSTTT